MQLFIRSRLDLRSPSAAKNVTASSGRCLLQNVRAAHVGLQNPDPGMPPPAPIGSSDAGALAQPIVESDVKKSSRLGNPLLSFQNRKVSAWKKVHAPDRSLTADEQTLLKRKATDQWNAMDRTQKDQQISIMKNDKVVDRELYDLTYLHIEPIERAH